MARPLGDPCRRREASLRWGSARYLVSWSGPDDVVATVASGTPTDREQARVAAVVAAIIEVSGDPHGVMEAFDNWVRQHDDTVTRNAEATTLAALALHERWMVRWAVARHGHTAPATLRRLVTDRDALVAGAATRTLERFDVRDATRR